MKAKDYLGIGALAVLVAVLPYLIGNEYYLVPLIGTALNCLTCIGLCLLMGYAGQISIGHSAFLAIGAYVSAIFTTKMGWSPWAAMGLGVVISSLVALIVGIPTLRLKGHYLAMATLGFASIVHIICVAAVEVTGGPAGLSGIPRLNLFGIELDTDIKNFYLCWGAVIIGLYLAVNLIHSRVGRGLRAIHGSEDAASSLGLNIAVDKIKVFIFSAMFASLSGSLYAHYMQFIDPPQFDVSTSVKLITMVAIGGIHSIWGAIIGAVLISLLPDFLSFLSEFFMKFQIHYNSDNNVLVFGVILLIIMLFLPEGLFDGLVRPFKIIKRVWVKKAGGAVEHGK